jgi:putative MATE family efflux protein
MTVVNLVNGSLCWMFCLGLGPIPQLGWRGIALGTACGYAAGGTLALVLLTRGRRGIGIQWRRLWPDWDLIRRLLKIGVPGGADTLSVIGCQLWFLAVINRLGELATAAHGVALSIESFAFLPGVAFQMSATTLCGQFLGAGNPRQAARSVWTACFLGAGLMSLSGIVIYLAAPSLAPLFVSAAQGDVALTAVPLVRTVAFAMPALGATMVFNGALRGAGDTRGPLVISILGFAGVRIPAAYGLAFPSLCVPALGCVRGAGLGVLGTWYAMAIDLYVRAALLLSRFLWGRWKHIQV